MVYLIKQALCSGAIVLTYPWQHRKLLSQEGMVAFGTFWDKELFLINFKKFIYFNVCECFAWIDACVLHVSLVPEKVRRHCPPGTVVRDDDCEVSWGCWGSNTRLLQQQPAL